MAAATGSAKELTLDDGFPTDRVLDVQITVAEKDWDKSAEDGEDAAGEDSESFCPELKGSIGEGSNHSNFSHQSSVKIMSKFNGFC